MIKVIVLVTLLLGLADGSPLKWMSALSREYTAQEEAEWIGFKMKYAKIYKSGLEEMLRKETFSKNLRFILSHNKLYENGLSTFTVGINQYADMDGAEFNSIMNGLNQNHDFRGDRLDVDWMSFALPSSVDWRKTGCVTPVKDQKQCGSCWAFSATGSLEAIYCLVKKKHVSLSEQQLVDCSGPWGNKGCNGGLPSSAFIYIKDNGGIDSEASYPYTAKQGTCKFSRKNIAATDSGVYHLKRSENSLQSIVAKIGPVSVGIDASRTSFQFYQTGIYNDPKCSSLKLNHGVVAVGYGTQAGNDYWIVKNSWGTDWGQSGYILMSRNKKNQCGIATMATFPKVP